MARKYQHVQDKLEEIKEMLARGMTQREVAEALGLEGERPIHRLLQRERRKERQGIPVSKSRGRKPARTLAEYKRENARLRMENELLLDFLRSTGRK